MNSAAAISMDEQGSARLAGPLTFTTVPGVYEDWPQLAPGCSRVSLNDVTEFDSAGLALLLEWSSILRQQGTQLRVVDAPAGLLALAELCDAEEWLNIKGRQAE